MTTAVDAVMHGTSAVITIVAVASVDGSGDGSGGGGDVVRLGTSLNLAGLVG